VGRLVELQIPPRSDHLALVRLVVEGAVRLSAGLPDGRVDDLRLAVSEACTNALDAQHAAASSAPITIRVELDDDEVAVTITDHAGGFEVDAVEPAPAATDPGRLRHEHGLGIPLMRSLVDEVTFTPTPGGTAVRLVVRT
jgi:serine/threonine-protein kinase RsbW